MDRGEPKYVSALPNRSTRGKRLQTLLEDEDSADEEFWNQDAFADESGDEVYESESEEEDVVDDDFHDEESSESEGEVRVEKERTGKRALKAPERKASSGKVEKARVSEKAVKEDVGAWGGAAKEDAGAATGSGAGLSAQDMELRKSKRATAQAILERSERMRAEREARPAPERQKVEYRKLTQEELLEEAKETEYWNLLDLERLLTLEAEMKKKAPTTSKKYEGPSVIYRSSAKVDGGATVIELARGAETPELLRSVKPVPAKPTVCVITGQPAKYKDPVTGMPYATLEAFKEVRKRFPPLPPKPKCVEEEEPIEFPEEKPVIALNPPHVVNEQPRSKTVKAKASKKRPGKPSASKISNVPMKQLKEEIEDDIMPDMDDEDDVMAEGEEDDVMAEQDIMVEEGMMTEF